MQQSKLEQLIFTIAMVIVMVYGMVCYNIAFESGGMTNQIFLIALQECVIMVPIAVILECTFVGKLAFKLAFRVVDPKADPAILVTIVIGAMFVCLMCPIMSGVGTLLFAHPGNQFIAVWVQKIIVNFPMALGWQIFVAGPLVRNGFKLISK